MVPRRRQPEPERERQAAPGRPPEEPTGERRHPPLLPGLAAAAERRQSLLDDLVAQRVRLGLTQTEVAARMGTSQSAVARLEGGSSDARLSTVERYAAAMGQLVDWRLSDEGSAPRGGGRHGR